MFLCVQAVVPIMKRQNYGKIVNITSGTVWSGPPMMLHYVSTKGAILGMTRALATELGKDGIRVNAIAPGLTSTDYIGGRNDYVDYRQAMANTRAIKREELPRFCRHLLVLFVARKRFRHRPVPRGRWRRAGALRRRAMANRLQGKVAIVTGAASGIGPSYAQGFAAEGAKVMIADVEPGDGTVRAIKDAGGEALSRICDVSDEAQVAALIRDTEKAFGGVHILVNNAAVFARFVYEPLDQIGAADWERAFAVNVRGAYLCVEAALPIMRRQSYGKVINIASGTVFKGVPMMLHYVATKARSSP